nr:YggS family pyridoxal phosphate-dependent enzyme [uncultured Flavobacterium sp.]
MSISENLIQIKNSIPQEVTLVAVSKTKPVSDILQAYQAGQRHFGENKIQEMTEKYEQMPQDIFWHMIGHVQTNKVKYMAAYVHLIHGVDSFKLLAEINKQAQKNNRVINCLLQVFIAQEETKFGLDANELNEILNSEALKSLKNINIVGLMGMASFTDNIAQIQEEFSTLNQLYLKHKNSTTFNINFKHLSMGMSGDYQIAIACGSNMIRIGSTIFGTR